MVKRLVAGNNPSKEHQSLTKTLDQNSRTSWLLLHHHSNLESFYRLNSWEWCLPCQSTWVSWFLVPRRQAHLSQLLPVCVAAWIDISWVTLLCADFKQLLSEAWMVNCRTPSLLAELSSEFGTRSLWEDVKENNCPVLKKRFWGKLKSSNLL